MRRRVLRADRDRLPGRGVVRRDGSGGRRSLARMASSPAAPDRGAVADTADESRRLESVERRRLRDVCDNGRHRLSVRADLRRCPGAIGRTDRGRDRSKTRHFEHSSFRPIAFSLNLANPQPHVRTAGATRVGRTRGGLEDRVHDRPLSSTERRLRSLTFVSSRPFASED